MKKNYEVDTGTLCDSCPAKCCRYFSLEIETPDCHTDFDNLRWYLAHEKVIIYTCDSTWYLYVENPCSMLDEHNRCRIYADRPDICRHHSSADCEHLQKWGYELKFTTIKELEYYIDAFMNKKRFRKE